MREKNKIEKQQINQVRQIKIALNRLGYYRPLEGEGITGEDDAEFYNVLDLFQNQDAFLKDNRDLFNKRLESKLKAAIAEKDRTAFAFIRRYVWRTVGDDTVRHNHAVREGRVFSWDDPPDGGHPGEDYNCRCWADPLVPMQPKGLSVGFEDLHEPITEPRIIQPSGRFAIPDFEIERGQKVVAAGVFWQGTRLSLSACLKYGPCRDWLAKQAGKVILNEGYNPPPKDLEGFPDAKDAKRKDKNRKRWKDAKGRIYEWDAQHGEVEIYDKTGKKHQGSFDPKTGKRLKVKDKTKKVEK